MALLPCMPEIYNEPATTSSEKGDQTHKRKKMRFAKVKMHKYMDAIGSYNRVHILYMRSPNGNPTSNPVRV